MKRPRQSVWTIGLTDKEFQYIFRALEERIRQLESSRLAKAGNIPHLIWFSKRVLSKLRKRRAERSR